MPASDGNFSFSLSSLAVDFCGMNLLSYSHYPFLGYHGIFRAFQLSDTTLSWKVRGFPQRIHTVTQSLWSFFIWKEGNPPSRIHVFLRFSARVPTIYGHGQRVLAHFANFWVGVLLSLWWFFLLRSTRHTMSSYALWFLEKLFWKICTSLTFYSRSVWDLSRFFRRENYMVLAWKGFHVLGDLFLFFLYYVLNTMNLGPCLDEASIRSVYTWVRCLCILFALLKLQV